MTDFMLVLATATQQMQHNVTCCTFASMRDCTVCHHALCTATFCTLGKPLYRATKVAERPVLLLILTAVADHF